MQIVRLLNFSPSDFPGACGLSSPLLVCRREPDMKKCFEITRLLCLSVLLSVFCVSAALAASPGDAPGLRVALLLEDAAPDRGWNDLLRQGLEQAQKELGVRTAAVVAPPQGSNGLTQEGIFQAAARQADLGLLSGARLHEILRNNAANFRQTKFGCIDTGIRAANIMGVTFADEQAAFLAGALLSQLHKHGLLPAPGARAKADELTLGWLAGEDDPQLKSMLNGFVEGVRLESPGARVINGVAGSYSSPDKGRAKAEELLGLDINALAVLAGRSGLGAVEAAIAQGRPLVGVDKDQQFLAPKLMLTSIVKRADRAVFEIVKATAQGAFAGNEIITYDLANGGVDIVSPQVWARHAGVRLPAAIERRLAELRLELTRGGIRLPSLRDRTLCNCR